MNYSVRCGIVVLVVLMARTASGQGASPVPVSDAHQHEDMETLFPAREGSGTSWVPAATPVFGTGGSWQGWQLMLHGSVVGQLLIDSPDKHRTGGAAGVQASSVNWGMVMARRPLGGGRFGIRTMLSAEPWTVSDCGFLNLLATGEMCEGDTIHDRQHPHDLFMELAVDFDHAIRGPLHWQLYAGLAGEPALGRPGFPHRFSAVANPVAPISHHWLDSSHITFGLITGVLYNDRWKGELSFFNGREPDDHRADFDLGALDSVSARLSFAPNARWVFQISSGHLNEAEYEFGSQPRSDLNRSTASVSYQRPFRTSGTWATVVAVGVNDGQETLPDGPADFTTRAALAESTLMLNAQHSLFGRTEVVEKPAHDLHAHEFGADVFRVGKVQGGYSYNFRSFRRLIPGIGATVSASLVPSELAPRYSGRVAWSTGVFVSLKPAIHRGM